MHSTATHATPAGAAPPASGSDLTTTADFSSTLRYAQCWEDADILLEALDIQPGDRCLSITSAGDNTLSMLASHPARVIAVDLNPAQLAALELRVAAYRTLSHAELLELIGSRPSARRTALFARCRSRLSGAARAFWDARPADVAAGIGAAGKFERYFAFFRRWVLPLVHDRSTVRALLAPGSASDRRRFHDGAWDTLAWRTLFRVFFSETLLGHMGRDPRLFRHARASVAEHLLARSRHALTELDPSDNPYLEWILTGQHAHALPHALRPEHFEAIRDNLDRLEWRCESLETLTAASLGGPVDRANLSDVFEYLSRDESGVLLTHVAQLAHPGARLAYWNMIVPRVGTEFAPGVVRTVPHLGATLFQRDKAFFYRDFIVEEVL